MDESIFRVYRIEFVELDLMVGTFRRESIGLKANKICGWKTMKIAKISLILLLPTKFR
jgi:hypothetical protein